MEKEVKEFANIYHKAQSSENNEERNLNYKKIQNYLKNPQKFVALMCESIEIVEKSLLPIFLVGINSFLKKNFKVWQSFTEKQILDLKIFFLKDSIVKNQDIDFYTSDIISTIYILDFKDKNLYKDLLEIIINNITNENFEKKKKSINIFCFILEKFFLENLILNNTIKESILNGIVKAFEEKDISLKKNIVIAFGFFCNYLEKDLENEKMRNYFFDVLVNIIINNLKPENEDIIKITINCLEELSKKTYKNFERYKEIVFKNILNCQEVQTYNIITTINSYFKTMLNCEFKLKKNFFDDYWQILADYCLNNLLKKSENDDILEINTGGKSLIQSFFLLLNDINKIYIKETEETLMNFICKYIDQENIKKKIIALIIFESFLENLNFLEIEKYLNESFLGLIIFLENDNLSLIWRTLRFIDGIIEYHYEFFLELNYFETLNIKLIQILNKISDTDICYEILKIYEKICLRLNFDQINNNFFDDIIGNIINSFFKNKNALYYLDQGFTVFFVLLSNLSESRTFFYYYEKFSVCCFDNDNNINQTDETKKHYTQGFLNIFSLILNKFLNCGKKNPIILTDKETKVFFNTFKFFKEKKKIYPDLENIIYFNTNMICNFPENFEEFFKENLKDIDSCFNFELNTYTDKDLFFDGVDSLILLIQNFPKENKLKNYCRANLKFYYYNLHNKEFNKELKNSILNLFIEILINFDLFTENLKEFLNTIIFLTKDIYNCIFENKNIDIDFYLVYYENIFRIFIGISKIMYLNNIYRDDEYLIKIFIIEYISYFEKFQKFDFLVDKNQINTFVETVSFFYKVIQNEINPDFFKKLVEFLEIKNDSLLYSQFYDINTEKIVFN